MRSCCILCSSSLAASTHVACDHVLLGWPRVAAWRSCCVDSGGGDTRGDLRGWALARLPPRARSQRLSGQLPRGWGAVRPVPAVLRRRTVERPHQPRELRVPLPSAGVCASRRRERCQLLLRQVASALQQHRHAASALLRPGACGQLWDEVRREHV